MARGHIQNIYVNAQNLDLFKRLKEEAKRIRTPHSVIIANLVRDYLDFVESKESESTSNSPSEETAVDELDLGKAENATEKTYFEAHPGGKGTEP